MLDYIPSLRKSRRGYQHANLQHQQHRQHHKHLHRTAPLSPPAHHIQLASRILSV
jgi:hypothetical protein